MNAPPTFSFFVPDFVDVYVPGGPAYVWLTFEFDGYDFDVSHASDEEFGEEWDDEPEPEDPATDCESFWRVLRGGVHGPYRMHGWLKDELDCEGWDSILPTNWRDAYDSKWVQFMLEEGIGPGQAFLVCIDPPRISKDYWSGEVDVTWDFEVVRIIPQDLKEAAERWDAAFKEMRAEREGVARERAERAKEKQRDTAKMFLKSEPYFSSRASSYDDMQMPDGISVGLWSSLYGWAMLASGRDDDGNFQVALDRLIETVTKNFPHLPPDICKTVPRRY